MSFAGVFAIGLSGVTAFGTSLEAVSQNIANSQTVGFKRARTDFADLVAATTARQGAPAGVNAVNRQLVAEQGAVSRTDTKTNAAVSGAGFFIVSDSSESGGTAPLFFTRAGDFAPDAAGNLVNRAGHFLKGVPLGPDGTAAAAGLSTLESININRAPALPAGAADPGPLAGLEFEADGRLFASYANGERYALYQIPLAIFVNEDGLSEGAATTFLNAPGAGALVLANPGEAGSGRLEGSAIEISTVDIGREFSTLIETQRAYASNARVIAVADELWRRLVETAA